MKPMRSFLQLRSPLLQVMLSGETAAGMYPIEAVKVMSRICREAEASLDYGEIFKTIISDAPMPMSPLESLASSAVRTANKVRAGRGTRTGDGTWDCKRDDA